MFSLSEYVILLTLLHISGLFFGLGLDFLRLNCEGFIGFSVFAKSKPHCLLLDFIDALRMAFNFRKKNGPRGFSTRTKVFFGDFGVVGVP